jgi:radical SAM superfamily enzyme YgiQ (UPF0313 family)
MKVLLVYPEFPDTFWSLKHALRFTRKRAFSPPLGLLTVAAMLPAEWDKRLIDLNVRALTAADLAWADCVLISAMVVQRSSARRLIARCRAAGKTVVAGGPLFTAEWQQFPEVDHLVLGEAERTLPAFLADLARGCARHVYHASGFADVHQTPPPLWELLDLRQYASMAVQFCRGCPFDCDFCNVTALFGRHPRTKTAGQVIAELDALGRCGWNGSVFFVDDNLIGNKKILRQELLPALIAWQRRRGRRPLSLLTQVSINLADDAPLMQLMTQAGFDTVFIGIETPSEDALAECGKRQNEQRDLIADVKRLQRAGLQVQGGFIVGFDSDSPSIFQRQIDFIQASGIVTAMVGILQAFQGTKLYERLTREGRVLDRGTGDAVDGTTNIIPAMDRAALREGYHRILREIYAPREYYRRVRTFLREYRLPKITTRLDRTRLTAFARSLYRLGLFGKERWEYWKLLLWTSVRRPRSFPLAVTLAICGYHHRRVCDLYVT